MKYIIKAEVHFWVIYLYITVPVAEAARSKAQVCRRLPAEIMGSNPTEGMDVCLLSLRRADHSSRGVLPAVVRR